MPLIKICGVRDPQVAFFAIKEGADLIGIILDPSSRRFVETPVAKEIAAAAKEAGGKAIGVFRSQTPEKIVQLAEEVKVDGIQLHKIKEKISLPLMQIHALAIEDKVPKHSEFLLFDNRIAGSGELFDWQQFSPPVGRRYFIAGGLNAQNVQKALFLFSPYGVDVSSGVEDPKTKEKNLDKIKEFIEKVRT